jgi:hypothetical protein
MITWTDYKHIDQHPYRQATGTRTSHEGLVVGEKYGREERVMSDVYDIVYRCTVWNPEKGCSEVVYLGCADLSLTTTVVTVDAPPEIRALFEAEQAALKAQRERQEQARAEAAERERELAAWHRPEKGKVMQVVRGRKVRKGTIGRVFWMDNMQNPTRVGLALTEAKDERGRYANVAWVDAAYLQNTASHPTLDA